LNAFQKVFEGSENILVEIIVYLIDIAMYYLLVDYKIEVIKTKHQNKVSKNYKV